DATQVKKLQIEREDLVVNPWRIELKRRTPEQITSEIEDHRQSAAYLMGSIWAAIALLLAPSATSCSESSATVRCPPRPALSCARGRRTTQSRSTCCRAPTAESTSGT